ncbi:MAG: serine--tRNA ligase, partial [Bacteroidota bacterium]
MLQLQVLRQNPEAVKAKLAKKHFRELNIIDSIIAWDEQIKKIQTENESIQANINSLSKETGLLMAKRELEKANSIKEEVILLKNKLAPLAEKLVMLENQLKDALVTIPNLPADNVPEGKVPADNKIIREG